MNKPFAILVLLAVSIAGCEKQAAPKATQAQTATLKIVGSSTMTPLVTELARTFEASHPGVRLTLESGGSGRGIKEARAGTADIGMASRALTDSERDLVGFSIARDGIAIVVNAANGVAGVSTEQVRDIFTGRITNWKSVGGADAPIVVIGRPEGRSSLEVFTAYFRLEPAQIKAAAVVGENAEATERVAAESNSISFVSVGEAERRAVAGLPVKALLLDGTAASSGNLRSGKYPVARPLTLVTRTLPAGPAKAFIDYALSRDAAPIVKKYDFVAYSD